MKYSIVLCLLVGILTAGCASKGPKHPEEHARFERIVQAVEQLRLAYVEKDLASAGRLLLPLEELDRLEALLAQDFEAFADISLDWSIERINIRQDTITVFVHWQGLWRKTSGDIGVRDRGAGTLEWNGHQVILLSGVGGDLPFGMAVRQALSSLENSKFAKGGSHV